MIMNAKHVVGTAYNFEDNLEKAIDDIICNASGTITDIKYSSTGESIARYSALILWHLGA